MIATPSHLHLMQSRLQAYPEPLQLQMPCISPVTPSESGAEVNLSNILAWSAKYGHTQSVAESVGIYPA